VLLRGEGWRGSELFSDREQATIAWAQAVTDMTAKSDETTWKWVRGHFDDRDLMTLTIIIGMWACSNRICEALHLQVEPPGQRIEFQKSDMKD